MPCRSPSGQYRRRCKAGPREARNPQKDGRPQICRAGQFSSWDLVLRKLPTLPCLRACPPELRLFCRFALSPPWPTRRPVIFPSQAVAFFPPFTTARRRRFHPEARLQASIGAEQTRKYRLRERNEDAVSQIHGAAQIALRHRRQPAVDGGFHVPTRPSETACPK